MGSGGAKQTNRLLEEQRQASRALADTAAQRSAEQYGQVSGLPGEILGHYRNIYAGIGQGGGPGGGLGPSYSPAAFESEALPFYLQMMREGGYTPEDRANILSYGTGPITGMFDAIKRRLQTGIAAAGMPSYGGGFADVSRDKAYAAGEMAKGVAADLVSRVLESRFRGASGVTGIESEKRAFEERERARALSAARAKASAGRASSAEEFAQRMAVLNAMGGYRPGTDIEYMDRAFGGIGQGAEIAGARRDETPLWQRALASAVPAAAGSAIGAFSDWRRRPRAVPTGGGGQVSSV